MSASYRHMLALAPWMTGVRWAGIILIIVGIGGTILWNR